MTDEIRRDYRNFFLESPAGEHFMKHLTELITQQHELAEKNPELARDYTQRAKGIRETLDHIRVATVKAKKGKNRE